jgi:hypothetical protein
LAAEVNMHRPDIRPYFLPERKLLMVGKRYLAFVYEGFVPFKDDLFFFLRAIPVQVFPKDLVKFKLAHAIGLYYH